MEATIKKEIVYILNTNSEEVLKRFPCEEGLGVIDFTGELNINVEKGVAFKSFIPEDYKKAWNQLKRWVSSESFNEVIIMGGLDFFPSELVFDWLFDHKSKKGFPKMIFSGKKILPPMEKIASTIF
jgi:hypothetical protein